MDNIGDNMEKLKEIQKETMEHYGRMIEFAKTQNKHDRPDKAVMLLNIGEHWQANYCPYCKEFKTGEKYHQCDKCPLNGYMTKIYMVSGLPTSAVHCFAPWEKLFRKSKTWQQWIKNAEKVIKYVDKYGAKGE